MLPLVAERKAPVVMMHMQGTPRDMQVDPHYENCVVEIVEFFRRRIALCVAKGVEKARIIIDPGIGFGKRLADNLDILYRFEAFTKLGVAVMVAASRKSFIGMLHDKDKPADQRLGGSVSAALVAVMKGAAIVRSHDVAETVEALKVLHAVEVQA
jgi:dihydropteroate synthase